MQIKFQINFSRSIELYHNTMIVTTAMLPVIKEVANFILACFGYKKKKINASWF